MKEIREIKIKKQLQQHFAFPLEMDVHTVSHRKDFLSDSPETGPFPTSFNVPTCQRIPSLRKTLKTNCSVTRMLCLGIARDKIKM